MAEGETMNDNVCQDCGRSLGLAVLPGHVTHATHVASHSHRFHAAVTRRVVDGWVPLLGVTRDRCVRLGLHVEWDVAAKVDRTDPVAFLRWEEWEELKFADTSCVALQHSIQEDRERAARRIHEAARIVRDEGPIAWWLAWILSGLPDAPALIRFAARVPGALHVPKDHGGVLYPNAASCKLAIPEIPGGVWDTAAKAPTGIAWLCERDAEGDGRSRRRVTREGGWSPEFRLRAEVSND